MSGRIRKKGELCWLVKAVQLRLKGVLRATTSSVTNPRHLRMAFWGNMDLWVHGNVFLLSLLHLGDGMGEWVGKGGMHASFMYRWTD